MSVCHQWRAAAIRTRRIWSRILLTHAVHDPQRPNERRWLGYEACHTIPLLQKALDRAADAPLHISLDFGHRPEASVSGEEDTLSRQLLETLGTSGADRRIFELDAKFASIEWIKKIEFDKFEFSALEMAWLTTSLRNLNACIKKTSPCLRWLHLEKYPGDALDWDLSGMTRLVLLWLSGGQGRVPCGLETIKMIRSASHLTELRVWYLKLPYLPGDESLSIPSLLTLVLLGAEVECKLDLPNLQTLTINSSTVSKSEADPLIFPSLTSMTIIKGGPDGLLHIRAPKPLILDIMIFDTLSLIPTLNGIMNHVILLGHLSIRVLRLTTREINPQSLTDFVGKILHLEEVEFHGLISRPKEFFDDLAGPPPSAKTQLINKKPICTSLKTFRLHIPPIASSTAEKAMMKWFRKAVEARKKGMYPIEEAFYWKTDLEIWVPVL
ncbi:hypothetical protein FRC16_000772 [Serendipita sp. 398]|nr:hypothetical protein FRC16_000772 [Serendipita sp. 398]KAG8834119.1 hypothetical protein FRC18_002590 [Serendipita sp. 400]